MRAFGKRSTLLLGLAIFAALAYAYRAPIPAEATDPILYDQEGTIADTGSIRSYDQTDGSPGEASNQGFGADDFTVPGGTIWHVTALRVHTQFAPTQGTWNAIFYNNANGNVGAAVASCTFKGIPNASAIVTPYLQGLQQPNFVQFSLPGQGCYLQPGTYWLSVYSAGDFPGAFFAWTSRDANGFGNNARFKNDGPGQCSLWSDATTCHSTNGKVGNCNGSFDCARALDFTMYGTTGAPDLTVVKSKNTPQSVPFPTGWTWTFHVANQGSATASFGGGKSILVDSLPDSGLAYGAPSVNNVSGATGVVACVIDGAKDLKCTASGPVTLPAQSSFDVQISVTPTVPGIYLNPRFGSTCKVDPDNLVFEIKLVGDAESNFCSDSAISAAPDLTAAKSHTPAGDISLGQQWQWKVFVANQGLGTASFAANDVILVDSLPDSGVTYSNLSNAATITASAAGLTGSVNCTLGNPGPSDLKCVAGAGGATLSLLGHFDVTLNAVSNVAGSYSNPRPGAANGCMVDPNGVVTEYNPNSTAESNNTCSDSVTVKTPDLTVVKSSDHDQVFTGKTYTWTLRVTNGGDGAANFAAGDAVLRDELPSSRLSSYDTPVVAPAVGGLSCSISATFVLTCSAGPGGVKIAAGTSFDVKVPVHATQEGTFTNPRTRGTCAVDPDNKVVEDNRGSTAESNNACNSVTVTVSSCSLRIEGQPPICSPRFEPIPQVGQ